MPPDQLIVKPEGLVEDCVKEVGWLGASWIVYGAEGTEEPPPLKAIITTENVPPAVREVKEAVLFETESVVGMTVELLRVKV